MQRTTTHRKPPKTAASLLTWLEHFEFEILTLTVASLVWLTIKFLVSLPAVDDTMQPL